jgi:hypothetical protein
MHIGKDAWLTWLPCTAPPIHQDPGEFMVEKAEDALPVLVRQRIPEVVETGLARLVALGYGLTFGMLYALFRPTSRALFVDGLLLGVANWATGYLGWLPAAGLMPPVWRQSAPQALTPIAEHVLYGIATVASYNWLRKRYVQRAPRSTADWR